MLEPRAARRFLRRLSDGTPPPPPEPLTPWLTVGRDGVIDEFKRDLVAVKAGAFRTLIIVGGPGTGKSQLLMTFEQAGRSAEMVTSYFSQDIASRVAFNRPDTVYRRIIETLRLPDDPRPTIDPLRTLLDRWVAQALPSLNGTRRSMAVAYRLADIGMLPALDRTFPYRTRLAVTGYVLATEAQDEEAKLTFLGVLKGDPVLNRDLLQITQDMRWYPKGNIGFTPGPYDTSFYFEQLRCLVWIMRTVGYGGLVLLFDEVTAIVDLMSRSREKAYKVIDAILFNEFSIEGFYPIFSYMPAFVNRLLHDRLASNGTLLDRWEELWRRRQREVTPLRTDDVVELLYRLSTLHGSAYEWQAWDSVEREARRLAAKAVREDSATRDIIRAGLAMLDEAYTP